MRVPVSICPVRNARGSEVASAIWDGARMHIVWDVAAISEAPSPASEIPSASQHPNQQESRDMNPLNDFPAARRFFYYTQFVVAGLILLVGIGFSAAEASLPVWYVVTSAVTQGLWSYLGLTAAKNVTE